MKHTNEICKQCGSRQRGLSYERALLEDADIKRIRICTACTSEYFIYEDLGHDAQVIEELFKKCYTTMGLSTEQATMISQRMFLNQLKF